MLLIERTRANTADPFHLPAFASVKLFTYPNPGVYLLVRYALCDNHTMNTTHTQAIGLPASFNAKFVMLTNICNSSIATPRRIVYSANSLPLDENTKFNVYEINKGLLCFDVTIDTALITLRELNTGKVI